MRHYVVTSFLLFGTLLLIDCGSGIARDATATAEGDSSRSFSRATVSRRIFVTQQIFNGNLGGPRGADAFCQIDPAKPAGPSMYKALLTDSAARVACLTANCVGGGVNEHRDWVLTPDMNYVRPDGTYIGTADPNGLLAFPLTNAIAPGVPLTWTGLKDNYTGSIYHCAHFTAATGNGNLGGPSNVTGQAIDNTFAGCGQVSNPIFCVEQ